jgi:DHA2 family multidrug resistance protein
MSAAAASMPKFNPWLVAVVVSLATFMEVLDTTITNVSIRHIGGSLGAGTDEATWVLTSYLVANGIILPLSGWLAGVMGRKRFFLTCIAGFTLASFACGASTSLAMLIVCRLIQGAAGGGLQPTQQAIILDSFPPSKRGQVFAITGITMIAAPILGPTLGGLITDNFNWRWIFYINIPVGITAFLLVLRMVEDPPHARAHGMGRVDYFGLGLIAIGLGALQIVLDKGQQDDWFDSNFIIGMAAVAVACIVTAIVWLWRQANPMVDLHLLRDRGFAMSCILIFMTGFVLYGGSTLLPLMLQTLFGYDATLAGMVLSPSGFAIMFLMPVSAKLIARVPAKYLVTIGMLFCAFGMYHSMHITPDTDYNTFLWIRLSQVIGLPFLFVPISTIAFRNIPQEKSSKASALFSLSRNIGGSIGIALAIAWLTRATQQRQTVLAEHTSLTNPVFQHAQSVAEQTFGVHIGLPYLYNLMQNQASLLGYIDTYAALCLLMLGGAIAAFLLLPKNNTRVAAAKAALANAH